MAGSLIIMVNLEPFRETAFLYIQAKLAVHGGRSVHISHSHVENRWAPFVFSR